MLKNLWEKWTAWKKEELVLDDKFRDALDWLDQYTVEGMVAISNKKLRPYPEVTGYLIPTLLEFGEHNLAKKYAISLVKAQNPDGSWSGPDGIPYIFDTAQALRGLIEIRDRLPLLPIKESVTSGANYICRNAQNDGRAIQMDTTHWMNQDGSRIPEWIHLYCVEPLMKAAEMTGCYRHREVAEGMVKYYKGYVDFITPLDHFGAYAADGLQYCKALPEKWKYATYKTIPGMFQYSILAYKRGNYAWSEQLFRDAVRHQRPSGAFYGNAGGDSKWYFPREEISWAVKFYLDAYLCQMKIQFSRSEGIPDTLAAGDPRLQALTPVLPRRGKILDAGCGKGRYALLIDQEGRDVSCLDLTDKFMERIPDRFVKKVGSLHNIPFDDNTFNAVYCVEALEHALNPETAIRELYRVTTPGGTILIIDKNKKHWGLMKTAPWEQWYEPEHILNLLKKAGCRYVEATEIPWEGRPDLFMMWRGVKAI